MLCDILQICTREKNTQVILNMDLVNVQPTLGVQCDIMCRYSRRSTALPREVIHWPRRKEQGLEVVATVVPLSPLSPVVGLGWPRTIAQNIPQLNTIIRYQSISININ